MSVEEGDVQCFSEYMELWIHKARIDGLKLWLSGLMRIQVSLVSLEQLNRQLSACGFALHKDPDKHFIFRVMYTGCFVQLRYGSYALELNLQRRIHRFGGRSHSHVIKCPAVTSPPNREHIRCDPDFIQVTRDVPLDSWNKELQWSLALRGSLVVALEDASLIQANVERSGSNISIQGRRSEILRPVLVIETKGEFLPLKLVSGHYAYSMEATCPDVSRSVPEKTVLNIFKRRMGLTKRGGYENDTLSVSSVVVNQTDKFSWSENSDFVQLVIHTSAIQHHKICTGEGEGEGGVGPLQPFFRVDAVLSFKETNHKMHWTMENTLPCMRPSGPFLVAQKNPSSPEYPLTVSPTPNSPAPGLHSNIPNPSELSTSTLPKDGRLVSAAASTQKMTMATKAVSSTKHHSPEPATDYTAKPTERSYMKSSTRMNTRQILTGKQQTMTDITKHSGPSSTPFLVKTTSNTYTVAHTSSGVGQTLEGSWIGKEDVPQPPSPTLIHQTFQELSGSPLSEEEAKLLETDEMIPAAASVKSENAVTISRTPSLKSENASRTTGSGQVDQKRQNTSSILLPYLNHIKQSTATYTRAPQKSVSSTDFPDKEPISTSMDVSQPATIITAQTLHHKLEPSGLPTDITLSITNLPHTSPPPPTQVLTGSTQVVDPYSVHRTEEGESSGIGPLTPSSDCLETEQGIGISSNASLLPHGPGSLRSTTNQLVPDVVSHASDQSTTVTPPSSSLMEKLQSIVSASVPPQKVASTSHYAVTRTSNGGLTDNNEGLHSSTLARVPMSYKTEAEYSGTVEEDRSTMPSVTLIPYPESRMRRSEMILKGLLYGTTGHFVKNSGVLSTRQWTSTVKHQRFRHVYTKRDLCINSLVVRGPKPI
ncbi:uncharacterized protein C1orf127 homolog isoform X1 [Engraulis encrasicolus]|uniref:uncharacterized protein C1orf127 homolog isoform X1 n=1 Tax=Engraulis encrasicolus TaxID=184585 RepID=UPI002FD4BB19